MIFFQDPLRVSAFSVVEKTKNNPSKSQEILAYNTSL